MQTDKPLHLSPELSQKVACYGPQASPLAWVEKAVQRIDGHLYDQYNRPFLADILNCTAKKLVVEKCVQIGLSVVGMCRFLHKTGIRGLHSIYFLPTDDLARMFVQGRFNPFVRENQALLELCPDVDNVQQKRIGKSFGYFLGLKGLTRVHSTPADHLTFDEHDLMGEKTVETAHNRIENSPYQEVDYFSKCSLPDYGIDRYFKLSDQRYWHMRCPHCGKDNSEKRLLETFPECIGDGELLCLFCRRALDVREGEWVPDYAGREMAGFHVSRLIDPMYNLKKLTVEFANALDLANFYNSRLGLPYADLSYQLSAAELLEYCCTSRPMAKSALATSAGVDVGHKYLKVVISGRGTNGRLRDYLWIGTLKGEDSGLWRDLARLFSLMDVKRYVIDGEPETQSVKDFLKAYKRDGWACDYVKTLNDPHWDEKQRLVKVDRTSSLDSSHVPLRDHLISLPTRQSDDVLEFADHCENLKRQRQVDEDGAVSYTWVHNESDPDHFRHAFNYDCLCWYDKARMEKPTVINKTPPDIRRVLGLK